MIPRLTKIVCTLGPATCSAEQIAKAADLGINVARINLSHGSRESQTVFINTVREVNKARKQPIGILFDTRGSEIRTGKRDTPMTVAKDEEVIFYPDTMEAPKSDKQLIMVNYEEFARDAVKCSLILVDNGEMSFKLVKVNDDNTVTARAIESGKIGDRRHVNLPGAVVDEPILTERDYEDVKWSAENDVDFIALSFLRSHKEVKQVRDLLKELGKEDIRLISKIETEQSVDDIEAIIEHSDGIMIARGDLGAEIPYETLPAIQDEIVGLCMNAGKPVIVATHMLESMIDHPIPTRAEITDVAHAAMTMADSTMLSGETAGGNHPPLVIDAMVRILQHAEIHVAEIKDGDLIPVQSEEDARARGVVSMAFDHDVAAIVVFTRSGKTAAEISKFRPAMPIMACTEDESVQRGLQLNYGVLPMLTKFGKTAEETIQNGLKAVKESGLIEGDKVIVLSDLPKDGSQWSVEMRSL